MKSETRNYIYATSEVLPYKNHYDNDECNSQ